MKPDRLVEALDYISQVLREDYRAAPSRLDDYDRRRRGYVRGGSSGFGHALWMCTEAKKLAEAGRPEKAFRWLGFVQGFLWAKNVFSIEDFKAMGRPRPANALVLKVGDRVRLRRSPGVCHIVQEVRPTGYTTAPVESPAHWTRTEATADPHYASGDWEKCQPKESS